MAINFLCVGDVIGRPGRRVLREQLRLLQEKYAISLTIVNGENVAGGFGLTPDKANELLDMGIDVITSGNHIWDKKEALPFLENAERVLRPLNYPPGVPGRGWLVTNAADGTPVAVVNLQGRIFMPPVDCPFRTMDAVLPEIRRLTPVIVVDFHAEATSEKVALGRYLDGRVSVVFGTHTHVQTADEQVFPGGTAYITDLGLTGAHHSVIGMEIQSAIDRFLYQLPRPLNPEKQGLRLNAVVVSVEPDTGRAIKIERLDIPLEEKGP